MDGISSINRLLPANIASNPPSFLPPCALAAPVGLPNNGVCSPTTTSRSGSTTSTPCSLLTSLCTASPTSASTGDDQVGYWKHFVQEDAYKLCEQNIDSFLQLLYPAKPEVWLEWFTPSWKSKEWVEANRTPGRPTWLSEEEYNVLRETLVRSGLKSPLTYYRAFSADSNVEEDKKISQEALQIRKPALFIATSKDYVCTPRDGRTNMAKFAPHAKIVELNVGHWAQMEATEQFNRVLEDWIQSLPSSGY
ncbi:hypothetical protein NUW54_g11830 [Trametes sanguinea]|uniref:Uncharacterized protein n=1 Tax=Trametes sanguinea TaxID=158606 RepID=A0ACC1N771_9APHY|nr:hypothetical protein NUW54_g11830 [Trametes sanguinea]